MQAAPCPGIQTVAARGPYKKRLVSMNIPVIVLCAVFVLIAVRRAGNLRLGLWQIMLLGAVAVLVTGQIGPREALGAIDPDIMLFLFGVFVVGQALEESGYLFHLSYLMFRRAGSTDEPGKAKRWRRARDSRTTVRRRVIVASLSRRTVAAKECAA